MLPKITICDSLCNGVFALFPSIATSTNPAPNLPVSCTQSFSPTFLWLTCILNGPFATYIGKSTLCTHTSDFPLTVVVTFFCVPISLSEPHFSPPFPFTYLLTSSFSALYTSTSESPQLSPPLSCLRVPTCLSTKKRSVSTSSHTFANPTLPLLF